VSGYFQADLYEPIHWSSGPQMAPGPVMGGDGLWPELRIIRSLKETAQLSFAGLETRNSVIPDQSDGVRVQM
jgi:hypothetical protein